MPHETALSTTKIYIALIIKNKLKGYKTRKGFVYEQPFPVYFSTGYDK